MGVMERRQWLRATPFQLRLGPCGAKSPYPSPIKGEGTVGNLRQQSTLDITNHIGYMTPRPATAGQRDHGKAVGRLPALPQRPASHAGAGSTQAGLPAVRSRTAEAAKTG